MTENDFFPVKIEEIPSKAELISAVNKFVSLEKYNPVEKYVIVKAYEYFIKEAINKLKQPAIKSFLETKQGVTNDFIFGADVKITGERITVTHEKYTYSEAVKDIENKIEKKQSELKLLQDKLKLQKTMEINQNIAKRDCWEETQEPQYGITITLRKK